MANTTNKFQYPSTVGNKNLANASLPSFKHLVGAEHFPKNGRSAIYFYWDDYMGKLLKVPDLSTLTRE